MLSVIVLTKNEEDLLDVCLQSVAWADELIVIDDDSTDKTTEIAQKYTDKVIRHAMKSFPEQRNFAMDQAHGDWVFYVDADERVTRALKDEIIEVTQQSGTVGLYDVPRRNFWLGVEQHYAGGWPDNVIRLIKKEAFVGWKGALHEHAESRGELGHVKQPLIHLTHRDITQMTEKTLRWSHSEAQLRLDAHHPKMTSLRFFRILITTFWDWYIVKRGYKGSTEGTIESIFQTFSMFISYVRLWELQQDPSLAQKYKLIDEKLVESGFSQV